MNLKRSFLSFALLIAITQSFAQFGPIGYDFKDIYITLDSLKFAVRLSTESNIYSPELANTSIVTSLNKAVLKSTLLSAAGGQITNEGTLELNILKLSNGRYVISVKGSHSIERVKTIQVLIKGIDVKTMVSEYPQAEGVNAFKNNNIMVSYPSRAATMPLVFLKTPHKEWFILSKDKEIRRKAFGVSYDYLTKESVVLLSHDEDSRKLSNSIIAPEWILGSGISRLSVVKERCEDLEKNLGILPYSKKNDTPWIDDLKLVAFFHGMHWTGHVFNTFEQMGENLDWLTENIDGKNLMAFLPAWDGRYYLTYPEHEPAQRMGGKEGLKKLVKKAHDKNVKVILMLGGPNLASTKFLKEHNMMDAALKGTDGHPMPQNWLDWNIDLSKETTGMLMNFGHPKYLDYMIEKTADLFDTYDVDGVFLDGTLRWQNSFDYSPYEGLVAYTKEIRARYPDKLIMGEDGYDAIYPLFDLFHTSGGPLGLENFMLKYTRQFYYLSYPAENGSAGIHEVGWSKDSEGIKAAQPEFTIPSMSLFPSSIKNYGEVLKAKIEKAKAWELGHSPIMEE